MEDWNKNSREISAKSKQKNRTPKSSQKKTNIDFVDITDGSAGPDDLLKDTDESNFTFIEEAFELLGSSP